MDATSKRLAVLGLAFKGDTDDIRESPAIAIIKALLKEGAQIRAFDPAAMPKTKPLFTNDAITFADDPYQAAAGCDALLILTEWSQFATLDLQRMRTLLRHPILIDGPKSLSAGPGGRCGIDLLQRRKVRRNSRTNVFLDCVRRPRRSKDRFVPGRPSVDSPDLSCRRGLTEASADLPNSQSPPLSSTVGNRIRRPRELRITGCFLLHRC